MTADLQSQIATAKAAKIAKLRDMMAVVDREDRGRDKITAFQQAGGRVVLAPKTNSASYAGVRATCTWSVDGGLMASWSEAALRQIKRIEAAA